MCSVKIHHLPIILLLLGIAQVTIAQHEHHVPTKQQTEVYTCPMHPEVQRSKPGKCPKCGMSLVKKESKAPAHQQQAPQKKAVKANPAAPTKSPVKHKKTNPPQQKAIIPVQNPEIQQKPIYKAGHKPERPGPGYKPRIVRYHLYVQDTLVKFTGRTRRAVAINGSIPAPALTFTQGDTAEIYVHNEMEVETAIHWHGVFLPNRFDGVPWLTQQPIKPHSTYLYKFPIIQNGTYWYHSHSGFQEQSGMYVALIFNKVNEPDMPAIPVVLSDWTDMNPREVYRSLRSANDWFSIRKGATQGYAEAIKKGYFGTKLKNEWKRMTAMDVSDVAYEKLLTNGQDIAEQTHFTAGDKVKLRVVNGGASTYFWLTYSGGKITVVANDGNDVDPVEVDRLIIAPAETYDLLVTIPENMQYEFLATAEDRTNTTSLWLGRGMKMPAQRLGRLRYFDGMKMMNGMMKMSGDMEPMGMEMSNQQMDMNSVMYPESAGQGHHLHGKAATKPATDTSIQRKPPADTTHQAPGREGHARHNMSMGGSNDEMVTLNYGMLRSPEITTLKPASEKVLRFELTGNMNRYVWTLDNKTILESDRILIRKGENVKIIMFNNSMMRHPMHLHGHDFRVLNKQGAHAPLKNTLDILPMETDTIEFAASESGDWFFHCHILYHMAAGMGRVFTYLNSPPNPALPDPKRALKMFNREKKAFLPSGQLGLESNGSDGEFVLASSRFQISTEWRIGFKQVYGIESETYFGRYLGKMQWLFPFIGFDYHYNSVENEPEDNLLGQVSNQDNRKVAVAGVQYTLPMLIVSEVRVDSRGKLRFQLRREDVPLTSRLRLNLMGNSDQEYMAGLRYVLTKYVSLSTHYDSDMKYGAGLTFVY